MGGPVVVRVGRGGPDDAADLGVNFAFFDEASALQSEMEAIADSYNAAAVNYPCLEQSNKGSVPAAGVCKILRP